MGIARVSSCYDLRVSDINIQLPWWWGPLLLVASAFWPLTAAAAAATWLWFRRTNAPTRIVSMLILALWTLSASLNLYRFVDDWRSNAHAGAELQSRQLILTEPRRIAGITLPAKTVVTRRYGKGAEDLETVDLVEPADIHGIPLIGRVEFNDAGQIDGTVSLAHDASIGGIPCSAKADTMVLSGKLATCTLTRPYTVHGVPCTGKLDVAVGVSCTLAKHYVRFGVVWSPQTYIDDSPMQGKTWIKTGPAAPSLRLLGAALPEKTDIEYASGQLSTINLGTRVVHYDGSAINVIDVRGHVAEGEVARASMDEPMRLVSLPADAIKP